MFTSDPKKYASTEELKAYDEQISSSQVPSQLGDLKPEDLSGPEALLNPGTIVEHFYHVCKLTSGYIEIIIWQFSYHTSYQPETPISPAQRLSGRVSAL